MRGIIPSGVALLDDWLSGVRAGATHLLTGGSGSGKSAVALSFADAALRRDEPVALLVDACADDVKRHAAFLGVDLDTPLRDGRLLLLRYRADFVSRQTYSATPTDVVNDLEHIIAAQSPACIVIDSFVPFVSGPAPVGQWIVALVAFLERSAATKLLTFPEDLSSGYDRTLEPLVQSAAAVIRLRHAGAGLRHAELVNLRDAPPRATTVQFVVRERVGIVAEHAVRGGERLTLRVP